jgi:hypothetical protein
VRPWLPIIRFALCIALALTAGVRAQETSFTLRSGATLPGRMVGCDGEGRLVMTAPFLHGQARVPLGALASVQFKRTKDEADAPFLVRLTNGDRVAGTVTALGDDGVALDTPAFGRVTIPRKFLHSIDRRAGSPVLLEEDYRLRGMAGWSILDGGWSRTPRGLFIKRDNRAARAMRSVPHAAPFTLVAYIATGEPTADAPPAGQRLLTQRNTTSSIVFSLLCDSQKIAFAKEDRLYIYFTATTCWVRGSVANGFQFFERFKALTARGAWIRVALEPKPKRLRVWVGEQKVADMTLANGFPKARVVSVISTSSAMLRCLGLYDGVVALDDPTPFGRFAGDRPTGNAGEAAYRIVLKNGDRVGTSSVKMDGDALTATTPDGEFKIDWDKVARIVAPVKGREAPAAHKNDVRLGLQYSDVTGRLGVCTEREMNLTSSWGEKLKIEPALVARIDADLRSNAPDPPALACTARATLKDGTRLPIALVGIADGRATLRAAWIVGEAQLELKAVSRLTTLKPTLTELPGDELTLTDGSVVCGALAAIDAEAFRIKAEFGQEVAVPRGHVASARVGRRQDLFCAHDFRNGKSGPWHLSAPEWQSTEAGVLRVLGKSDAPLGLPLQSSDAVTVELTLRKASPRRVSGQLSLLSRKRRKLTLLFSDRDCKWQVAGLPAMPLGRLPAFDPAGGTVIVAWDATTKRLTVWGKRKLIGTVTVSDGPPEVSKIELGTAMTGHICESLNVWRSVMPGAADPDWADERLDVVRDKAGRFYRTNVLGLADGKLTLAPDDRPATLPWADVRMLIMHKAGRAAPELLPGRARVTVGRSELLMRIERMTDEHLEGESAVLGKLRIPRTAVRDIEWVAPATAGE